MKQLRTSGTLSRAYIYQSATCINTVRVQISESSDSQLDNQDREHGSRDEPKEVCAVPPAVIRLSQGQ